MAHSLVVLFWFYCSFSSLLTAGHFYVSALSTVGSRAFPVAGPRIWNALPQETTSAQSLSLFYA